MPSFGFSLHYSVRQWNFKSEHLGRGLLGKSVLFACFVFVYLVKMKMVSTSGGGEKHSSKNQRDQISELWNIHVYKP